MTPDQRRLVEKTAAHAERVLGQEGTGHDWLHVRRVWLNARRVGRAEGADLFVVELAALLHDIADWKFHGGDLSAGPKAARRWLLSLGAGAGTAERVARVVAQVSYKGAKVADSADSLEAAVVQDADRLDALGAVGIARTFAYGGSKGRAIYDPAVKPVLHASSKAYSTSTAPTLNHFYEKLLLLKGRMKTRTGRRLAAERHRFMELFLRRFYAETGARPPR